MRQDRGRATELRRSGKSYREIAALLGVPRGTLSYWFHHEHWSLKVKKRLIKKAKKNNAAHIQALIRGRQERLRKLYEQARADAHREFIKLKTNPLFIAGIALYWGEGNKASRHNVTLTNTDPAVIRVFINFLYHICEVPRLRVRTYLLLYPDLDDTICRKFWIKNTGLMADQFTKSVFIQGRHKTRRVQYGICVAGVTNTCLKEKIRVWMELLPSIIK